MSNKYSATTPNAYLEPRMGTSGVAAWPAKTVIDVFHTTVEKFPNRPALCYKRPVNGKLPQQYSVYTYREYWAASMQFAKALVRVGVECFEIISILGFNSHEWFIANCGATLAGAIPAGIYTTNGPDACHYISEHSKSKVVVVEGNKQLEKYTKMQQPLPELRVIVVWGEPIDSAIASRVPAGVQVVAWEAFLTSAETAPDSSVDVRWANIRPGNCASLIYTSGTTGPPKAVMISHDNITWTSRNIIDHYMDLNHEDCAVSYLPLSHIAAQLIDIHCLMAIGGACYFAQPDALKGTLTVTMKEVRPTFFFGVPRVWEKIQEKMVELGRQTTGVKKSISTWAKGLGTDKSRMAQYGEGGGHPWGYGCANSLVFSKVKEALGLDQVKSAFTAAAPIAPETLWYFASLDIPVYEVFGQSECTGPHTVSAAKCWKVGYCGRPILGSESKIDSNTGELCYRGRHIFMGYMYMPKETADTIDEDGYLHSGDVAEFDNNDDDQIPKPSGFMKITGRIKELIITAGGENVPPVLIENEMKAAMLAVSNCMVIGDKRKFLTMLVAVKVNVDPETGIPGDKLAPDSLHEAKRIGSSATTYTEVKNDPLWKAYIDAGMKAANKKSTSNAQIVQKWAWLPLDFCEKHGELTPTLKLKRKVVAEKYASLIEALYSGSEGH